MRPSAVTPETSEAEVAAAAAFVISESLKQAREFLATLPDPRMPWSAPLTAWCRERGISEVQEREIRRDCLRVRMFGAIQRSTRRVRR